MREWRGRAEGGDGRVRVALGPEAPLEGDWLGLDDEGALLLKGADGPARLGLERLLTPTFQTPGEDALERPTALTRLSDPASVAGKRSQAAQLTWLRALAGDDHDASGPNNPFRRVRPQRV